MKEQRLTAIKDFSRFIDNFKGELIVKGKFAYHNNKIVYTYEIK